MPKTNQQVKAVNEAGHGKHRKRRGQLTIVSNPETKEETRSFPARAQTIVL